MRVPHFYLVIGFKPGLESRV